MPRSADSGTSRSAIAAASCWSRNDIEQDASMRATTPSGLCYWSKAHNMKAAPDCHCRKASIVVKHLANFYLPACPFQHENAGLNAPQPGCLLHTHCYQSQLTLAYEWWHLYSAVSFTWYTQVLQQNQCTQVNFWHVCAFIYFCLPIWCVAACIHKHDLMVELITASYNLCLPFNNTTHRAIVRTWGFYHKDYSIICPQSLCRSTNLSRSQWHYPLVRICARSHVEHKKQSTVLSESVWVYRAPGCITRIATLLGLSHYDCSPMLSQSQPHYSLVRTFALLHVEHKNNNEVLGFVHFSLHSISDCSANVHVQVAYLVLYASGYGLYWQYVFKLLPNDYASEYHM